MAKITKKEALNYHALGKPGKIEVVPTKPHATPHDLSLAYSPGVAEPCLEIEKDAETAYDYTAKGNLVAVISNGTAVLGLGDIGALSGKPVMEGKGLLFKVYAGIDVFDIELDEKDPERFIQAVKAIAPTFGGINLEDIKSPECFTIEQRLKEELDIPVMHDDQHGTAIISGAGLLNALVVAHKKIEEVKIVVSGAGASAISCTKMYVSLGAKKENIIMLDSQGVITKDRPHLNILKQQFASSHTELHTLEDALKGADVFLGLSKGGLVTQDMIRSMNKMPIVFALANPTPEISYEEAMASRDDVLMATGRSDYPNQINNVLGFPYIFRGALDVRAKSINEEMKIAAVHAVANLARRSVPDVVNTIYGVTKLAFGPEYFIPKPVDQRLIVEVSIAVAKAAMDSGVARKSITDWTAYRNQLMQLMGYETSFARGLYDLAKTDPQRVVFAEGNHPNIIRAAVEALDEGICKPILIGQPEKIHEIAQSLDIDMTGVQILDHRSPEMSAKRKAYASILNQTLARQGYTLEDAKSKIYGRNFFAMMMVKMGDADAFVSGLYTKDAYIIEMAKDVIGLKQGYENFATMHIFCNKKGKYFFADTMVNRQPDQKVLTDVVKLSEEMVRFFANEPRMAMISHSNFGADQDETSKMVSDVVSDMHKQYPNMVLDGEMQMKFALNNTSRDSIYPFTKLKGKRVNTFIFPNLNTANTACQLMNEMNQGESIGPIQMGLNKPIHFVYAESSVRDIVNVTAVAVIDAITKRKR